MVPGGTVPKKTNESTAELRWQLIDVWNDLKQSILIRLLTTGEEDFKHVSVLKENTTSTACELTMLILSISVTSRLTCLTVASLITIPCQQRWPIHSCSFYSIVHYQIWGAVVDIRVHLVSVNYNSERITKIGQYLPNLC